MVAEWSLPKFVALTVYGSGDATYQADIAGIAGVQYVRRMSSLESLNSQFYVAADPESWSLVAQKILNLPGVDRVEAKGRD